MRLNIRHGIASIIQKIRYPVHFHHIHIISYNNIVIIPLYLHIFLSSRFLALIKGLDKSHPVSRQSAMKFFIDKPTVKAIIIGYLIQLTGIWVFSAFFSQHLTQPCRISRKSPRWEKQLTQNFYSIHVRYIHYRGRRRYNNAFSCRSTPPNQQIHILPISRIISENIVRILRRSKTAFRIHCQTSRHTGICKLRRVRFHRIIPKTWLKRNSTPIKFRILVIRRLPVLNIVRMPTWTIWLLRNCTAYAQNNKKRNK